MCVFPPTPGRKILISQTFNRRVTCICHICPLKSISNWCLYTVLRWMAADHGRIRSIFIGTLLPATHDSHNMYEVIKPEFSFFGLVSYEIWKTTWPGIESNFIIQWRIMQAVWWSCWVKGYRLAGSRAGGSQSALIWFWARRSSHSQRETSVTGNQTQIFYDCDPALLSYPQSHTNTVTASHCWICKSCFHLSSMDSAPWLTGSLSQCSGVPFLPPSLTFLGFEPTAHCVYSNPEPVR